LLDPQAATPSASAAHPASAIARDFMITVLPPLGRWDGARLQPANPLP
jgi:hypothetical protein